MSHVWSTRSKAESIRWRGEDHPGVMLVITLVSAVVIYILTLAEGGAW